MEKTMKANIVHYFKHLTCTFFVVLGLGIFAPVSQAATGTFSFATATYAVSEGAGNVNITINRVGGSTGAATVQWRTNGGTASSGVDFSGFGLTTLYFAAGETKKIQSIKIIDDIMIEPKESFTIRLSSPTSGTTLGSTASTVVTILDNDTIAVDRTAPTVSLTSPTSTTFTSAQTVTITASAADNIGVSKVDLYDGATLKGTDTTAPYSFAWAITAANNGNHSLTAKAYDAAGNVTTTAAKGITVNIAVAAPAVYTTPVLNPVTINNGNYLLTWSLPTTTYGVPSGGYDIFVDGVDDNLHHTTLSAVKSGLPLDIEHCFVVEARWTQAIPTVFPASNKFCVPGTQILDVIAPTVSLTSPATGTTFTSAQTVTVSATAADNVGVSKVEFYDGATLKGSDTVAPYSFVWSVTATDNGSRSFTAKAYDAAGNSKSSSVVGVTVKIATAVVSSGPLKVFPWAEGFGTETPAGRGGQIIKVTNLNDSGTGSLREAVSTSGPRIVVFEVSGRIKLTSPLTISNPYITIAGQTAPSPGIQITDRTFIVQTHDVLVQHIRFRIGDEGKVENAGNWDAEDAIRIYGSNAYGIVFDHITANWSLDDIIDFTSNVHDVTVSNSIFAEPLANSVHTEIHPYISLCAYGSNRIFYNKNLFMSAGARQPYIREGQAGLANNLFYNSPNSEFTAISSSEAAIERASVVNNVYKGGPSGSPKSAIGIGSATSPGSEIFISGNTYDGGPVRAGTTSFDVSNPPTNTWPSGFSALATNQVESYVLENVGARPSDRDVVENRLINEIKTRTGHVIDSQTQVGGFPVYPKNTSTFNSVSNPNNDDDGDGYTNIEEILHQLSAQVGG